MRSSLLISTSFFLALSACTSLPPQACTQIGCLDGFSVEFDKPGPWRAGQYVVNTTIDGIKASCTVTLPFPSCNLTTAPCTSPDIVLGQSGCALPTSEHKLHAISTTRTNFKTLQVEVKRDGTTIGSGSFQPKFKQSQPNGPNCGPVCTSAPSVQLKLKD